MRSNETTTGDETVKTTILVHEVSGFKIRLSEGSEGITGSAELLFANNDPTGFVFILDENWHNKAETVISLLATEGVQC